MFPWSKRTVHKAQGCTGPVLGCRHIQVCMYFFLLTYSYCMRSVLSVAIVAMNGNSTTENPNIPVYNWTNQSVVLSSFFWGYVIFQVPAAQLGKKYGPKWLLTTFSAIDSVSCIMIPFMAEHLGSVGVMFCRFLQGLAQGGIMPLVHMLLGNWAPPNERSFLGTFAYTGAVVGNFVSLVVTGELCSSWVGWPGSFYLFGALELKWLAIWIFVGANKPSCHKSITNCEKKYIESSLGQQDNYKQHITPWKQILTSPPFWAVTLAFAGANWCSAVLLTQTPTYMAKILDYDIKSNSLLSAAPYGAMFIGSMLMSPTCDYIINRNYVSRGAARKIFNSIGMLGSAIILALVGFIPKTKATISVVIFILNGAFTSAGMCSFQVNHMDLSPNHAGIMMGMTNSSTSVFSIISPLIVQFIVTGDQTNQSQWRIIFLITASIYIVVDLAYILFASGEVQCWNETSENSTESTKGQDHPERKLSVSVIS